jgi:hypothetical protein
MRAFLQHTREDRAGFRNDLAGQLGATCAIPIIYVPVLMITHVVAIYLLLPPRVSK